MKLYTHPDKADWPAILERPVMEVESLESTVRAVLDEVQRNGDAALRAYTERFDGVKLTELKVSPAELAESEDFLEMFMDEARLAARMRHPNVVQTLEVSREDGVHYMVLEYCDKGDLLKLQCSLPKMVFPLTMATKYLSQVILGL